MTTRLTESTVFYPTAIRACRKSSLFSESCWPMRDIEYFLGAVVMLFLGLSGTWSHLSPCISLSRLSVAASPGSQLGRSQLGPRILIFLFNYLLSLYPRIHHRQGLWAKARERNKKNKLLVQDYNCLHILVCVGNKTQYQIPG